MTSHSCSLGLIIIVTFGTSLCPCDAEDGGTPQLASRPFVRRTLNHCHLRTASPHRQDALAQRLSGEYYLCLRRKWTICTRETVDTDHEPRLTRGIPCFEGRFLISNGKDRGFLIKTFSSFNLNLTFTDFKLEQLPTGCHIHYINVSLTLC